LGRLLDKLQEAPVICAEGYLFELERRGYLQAGAFTPEVVLDHPEEVETLHREFVHAGSDVVEAFTYYAHRERLRLVGREHDLAALNRQALSLASRVAKDTGTLLAGNISNTNVYSPEDRSTHKECAEMFDEQIEWAVEADVDYMIGETFSQVEEALLALERINEADLDAVVTMTFHQSDRTQDRYSAGDACMMLEQAGADVVGINCMRGPQTIMPLLEDIVMTVGVPVAALPVPYRTTEEQKAMVSLRDDVGERAFATGLDPFTCTRHEIARFTAAALELGVRYFGVCCGAGPHHIRAMAEALGRTPPASRYSEDMRKSALFGSDSRLRRYMKEYGEDL
jgi:betaine-homocysteine S-methyltransferase